MQYVAHDSSDTPIVTEWVCLVLYHMIPTDSLRCVVFAVGEPGPPHRYYYGQNKEMTRQVHAKLVHQLYWQVEWSDSWY